MEVSSLVEERVSLIVTRAFDKYSKFNTGEEYKNLYSSTVRMTLEINSRIRDKKIPTILPLKTEILKAAYTFNFNISSLREIFSLVAEEVFVEAGADYSALFKAYVDRVIEGISDLDQFSRTSILEHLLQLEAYAPSDSPSPRARSSKTRLNKQNRQTASPVSSRIAKKFNSIYSEKVDLKIGDISNSYKDINSITSDSVVKEDEIEQTDIDLLGSTFAGEGKSIYQELITLYNAVVEFSGFQGSLSDSVEYFSTFSEFILAMAYGKKIESGILDDRFGKFNLIYEQDELSGLSFLNSLFKTQSANQDGNLHERFAKGVKNRYVRADQEVGMACLVLESIYSECLKIGDSIQSLIADPLPGIGNTTYLLSILSGIFPPSLEGRSREKGFTAGVYKLLLSYRKLLGLYGYEPKLPELTDNLVKISSVLLEFSNTVRSAGFRESNSAIVPNLALTYYDPSKIGIRQNLLRAGFTEPEVEEILSVKTFPELVNKFAPITDSQDVISFFRAYELTKLIYEFGGQEGVDAYISFLYGTDKSVIRLLGYLTKNRSLASTVIASDYPKLVGYLITLTYAVNPAELINLEKVLRNNRLNLLESVSYLLSKGENSVLKSKEDIDMLSAVAAQMVTTSSLDYSTHKPMWNRLIEESAGNAKREELEGVYNRLSGIIPEELNSILHTPSAFSPVGKLIDGVRGGNFTSLLRYCNIFGLLHSLSPYRNSGQLVNNHVSNYGRMVDFLSSLDKLSERLKLSGALLESYIDETPVTDIVLVQNKKFSAFVKLIDGTLTSAGNEAIMPSPGIGNSRIPNGVRVDNSLTPEEAQVVQTKGAGLGLFSQSNRNSEFSSFIRFAQSNILSMANLSQSELTALQSTSPQPAGSSASTEIYPKSVDYSDTYSPSTTSAVSLLNPPRFNSATSCKRFGGSSCPNESASICRTGYNKALEPEEGYGSTPGLGLSGVPIDRPLGAKISSARSYPAISPDHPQASFSKTGLVSRMTSRSVFKNSEILCASLEDPFDYSACMSLLKCKRYGKLSGSLSFCPETLIGGRLE